MESLVGHHIAGNCETKFAFLRTATKAAEGPWCPWRVRRFTEAGLLARFPTLAMVATPGWARLGTRVSRLAMKWVRQRCQLAPAKTAAMAFFSPW